MSSDISPRLPTGKSVPMNFVIDNSDSVESDIISKASETEFFKEPTSKELEDAMSRIHDFFAQEDTLDHITDVLPFRSGRAVRQVGQPVSSRLRPTALAEPGGGTLPQQPSFEADFTECHAHETNEEGVPFELDGNDRALQPHAQKHLTGERSTAPAVMTVHTPRAFASGSDAEIAPSSRPGTCPISELTGTSTASGNNQSLLGKMKLGRLGITPTGSADDMSMRYLNIKDDSRDQFQHFAKELKEQLSVECAEFNPYVRALCAHRQEMQDSAFDMNEEMVDTMASRLATERTDNLATLTVEEQEASVTPMEIYCQGENSCKSNIRFNGELFLPELETRHQHLLSKASGHGRLFPSLLSPTASTDSTSAGSADSDPSGQRVGLTRQEDCRSSTLKIRMGRKRLELSEEDRFDFFQALVDPSEHSAVGLGDGPVRSCGGDDGIEEELDVDWTAIVCSSI